MTSAIAMISGLAKALLVLFRTHVPMANAMIERVIPKSGSATAESPDDEIDPDDGPACTYIAEEEGDEIDQDELKPDRGNQVGIRQQSHPGSDEEEGHVGKEIVPHRIKMTFLDDTEEKSQQCKHHGDDRAVDRQPKALLNDSPAKVKAKMIPS